LGTAVDLYTEAALQGDASAQCSLGYCYEHGLGVAKNLVTAAQWYTKAEESKNDMEVIPRTFVGADILTVYA
jgi:TPR repeat protein